VARPLRILYAEAFYHVTSRGNERRAVFLTDRDREKFLSYLESAHVKYGGIIHVYCLMDNHYHLLLETPRGNLSQILHHINGAYTTYFNVKRQRSGHLFQGRYRAILVEKDEYCQELSRYIHLNPVRAGMVKDPRRYRWSSYHQYIGLKTAPWLETGSILGYFDSQEGRAQRKYREYVERAIGVELKNPLEGVFASSVLGSEGFINWVREGVKTPKESDTRDIPVLKALMERPSLEEIKTGVEHVLGAKDPLFRKFCVHVSHEYGGYSLKEIGAFYNMQGSAVSQASRRLKQAITEEPSLKELLGQITQRLTC
jgi:REP element-mobilizing transposase RayT